MKGFIFYLVCCLIFSSKSFAASRFSFLFGFGSGASTNEETFTEGPYMVMFKLDHDFLPSWSFGIDHSRAIGESDSGDSNSSNISETSFGVRYFPFNGPNFISYNASKVNNLNFSVTPRGWALYLGLGLGFASAGSREENESENNASSLNAKIKGGLQWQWGQKYGLDIDGSYSLPLAGNGEVHFLTVGLGVYFNF